MPGLTNGSPYLPRIADDVLDRRLRATGAVLIEGVKACGKIETARRKSASEVLLDSDPEAERRAAIDPRLLLDGDTPRLLDEWQRIEPLWDAVRRDVDHRGKPGQFILAGSATPADDITRHSGAGRFGTLRMRTMTLTEKQATTALVSVTGLLSGEAPRPANCSITAQDYFLHISCGGWPALVGVDAESARDFLDGYLDVIVETDINEVSGRPRDPRLVRRFLHAYAQMVSQTAHLSTIMRRARDDADDGGELPARNAADVYLLG